ncbi:uncharacterized protein LOC110093403 [Dendrobium catenatum]|uniref:DUF1350 domain-containing protein n=1 Tax=Dendrobium catenatum TaxID=906689 RepID=A0A2I0W812_9ASPA|nr:uncharacterized protein LOC110093403 [Dendrobium catenatum]PKU71804.1 hypothetical protein MA16_Dca008333 [Dendrobium catenatum]
MGGSALYCSSHIPCSFRRSYPPHPHPRRRLNLFSGCISLVGGQKRQRQLGSSFLCYADENQKRPEGDPSAGGIQLYSDIEKLITETARQSQDGWGSTGDWKEIEGTWVLRPRHTRPRSIVHFIGGIFVGATPQLTYRLFLERLSDKGVLVIATPFASRFDHFSIADEVQLKYDRSMRSLTDIENDLPTFGIGHSLGSVIHLLIGSRYAVQRNGNVLLAFNNKEASLAIPLFSPVIVPMAQSLGPLLTQLTSSPSIRRGAEIAMRQLESLSPPILKQVLPLVEQLSPLYMDLVNGREDFIPKPEETSRLIKSYYGISRNLLIQFKDDTIDETPTLAKLLSCESAISSQLDLSIRSLPGDHGLPLQQVLPDVPPAMADAVNRGGELLANLTAGTPWESVAKEISNTLGPNSSILRTQISKDIEMLVDVITSWMSSNTNPRMLRP